MGKYIGGRCLELMPETIKKYPPQPCKQKSNDAALVLLGYTSKNTQKLVVSRCFSFQKGCIFKFYPQFSGEVLQYPKCGGGCAGLIELTTFPSGIETPAAESSLHWNPHPTVDANAVMPREDGRETWITPRKRGKPPPVVVIIPVLRIRPDTVGCESRFPNFPVSWQNVYRVTSVHKIQTPISSEWRMKKASWSNHIKSTMIRTKNHKQQTTINNRCSKGCGMSGSHVKHHPFFAPRLVSVI